MIEVLASVSHERFGAICELIVVARGNEVPSLWTALRENRDFVCYEVSDPKRGEDPFRIEAHVERQLALRKKGIAFAAVKPIGDLADNEPAPSKIIEDGFSPLVDCSCEHDVDGFL